MSTFKVYDDRKHPKQPINASTLSPRPPQPNNEASKKWLNGLLLLNQTKPHSELAALLRGRKDQRDKTAAIINQAQDLIYSAYPLKTGPPATAAISTSPSPSSSSPPRLSTKNNPAKAMASLQLYKLSLRRVLLLALQEAASDCNVPSPALLHEQDRDAAVSKVLDEKDILAGMVQACVEIVNFAYLESTAESFPVVSLHMGRCFEWLELLQGFSWTRRCSLDLHGATHEEGIVLGLPELPDELKKYVSLCENKILEELVFMPGSTLFPRLKSMQAYKPHSTEYSSPYGQIVQQVIKKVGRLADVRTATLCSILCRLSRVVEIPGGAKIEATLCEAASALVNSMLFRHFDVLFDRHLTVILIGAIYCTSQLSRINLRMNTLLKAAEHLAAHDKKTLESVSLHPLHTLKRAIRNKAAHQNKKNNNNNSSSSSSSSSSSTESEDGWGSEDDDEEINRPQQQQQGSVKDFYNAVIVPLVNHYGTDLTQLFGHSQAPLLEAIKAAGGDVVLEAAAVVSGKSKMLLAVSKQTKKNR